MSEVTSHCTSSSDPTACSPVVHALLMGGLLAQVSVVSLQLESSTRHTCPLPPAAEVKSCECRWSTALAVGPGSAANLRYAIPTPCSGLRSPGSEKTPGS